ncbi:MAG: hypothetical protein AAF682_26110 [Planctomycetota bacterium]
MSEAQASTRAQLLGLLIPPLVHRMNNLLAVVSGHCDIWTSRRGSGGTTFRAQVEQVRASAAESTRLIRVLSTFSKRLTYGAAEVEIEVVLADVRDLVTPFANESSVELVVARRGGAAVLETDPRVVAQAWSVLLAGILSHPRSARPARVRFCASIGPDRVALTLALAGREQLRHGPCGDAARALERFAAERGGALRCRELGQAVAWRLTLAARTELEETPASSRASGALLLLLEPDQLLADLMTSVLGEEGHRVQAVDDLSRLDELLEACRLVLVDVDIEATSPGLLRRLIDVAPTLVVLGGEDTRPGDDVLYLRKPFRPNELTAAVEKCLR